MIERVGDKRRLGISEAAFLLREITPNFI